MSLSQTKENSGGEGQHWTTTLAQLLRLEYGCLLGNCINIRFPVFDNCTELTRISFLDHISNQLIFNYGRSKNFSPFESFIRKKNGIVFSILYKYSLAWWTAVPPCGESSLHPWHWPHRIQDLYSVIPQIFFKAYYVSGMALNIEDT